MNLLDPGCLGPNFLEVAPRRITHKESGISVVKLGFLLN